MNPLKRPVGMGPSVTIFDVAERAGVSIKTVSRVLNNEPNVRASTRQRVDLVIAELRYIPNEAAQNLAGRRAGRSARDRKIQGAEGRYSAD